MTVTTTALGGGHEGDGGGTTEVHAHHDTPEHRDSKERLALWLFIGGDAVILALEIFTWFYTRSLNTNGMWRGAACTVSNPCTDGLGNPLTHPVPKASPWYGIVIAALAVVAALLYWLVEHDARSRRGRGAIGGAAGGALLVLLGAIALQCYQFGALPFTTIVGTYATTFIFFMGSTLVHLAILAFIGLGVWNRARLGHYDDGQWYRTRLVRMFAVWIAISICVLTVVSTAFA